MQDIQEDANITDSKEMGWNKIQHQVGGRGYFDREKLEDCGRGGLETKTLKQAVGLEGCFSSVLEW
jgi:hypothetical protein